jgi:hypothetical protein
VVPASPAAFKNAAKVPTVFIDGEAGLVIGQSSGGS